MPTYILPSEYESSELLNKLFVTCEQAFACYESFLQEEKSITADRILFLIVMNGLFHDLKNAVEPELFKLVFGLDYDMDAIVESLNFLTDGWKRLKQPKYNYVDMMVGIQVGNAEFLVSELLKNKSK